MSSADDDFKARLARFLPQQQQQQQPTQHQNRVDNSAKITAASTTAEAQPSGSSSSLFAGSRSLFAGVGSLLSRPPRTLGDGFTKKKPSGDNSSSEHQASHTNAHNSGAEPNGHPFSARPIASSYPSSDANEGRTAVVAPTPSVAGPAHSNYSTGKNSSEKSADKGGNATNTLKHVISPLRTSAPPPPTSMPRVEGTLFGRTHGSSHMNGGGPTEASSTRAPTPCGDNHTSCSSPSLGSAEGVTSGGHKGNSYISKFKLPPSRGARRGGGEPSPSSSSSSTSRSSSSSSSSSDGEKEKEKQVRGGEGQGEQGQDEWCHPVSPVTSTATSEPLYTPRMTTARARGATLPIKKGGLTLPAARGTISSNANYPDDASDDTNTNTNSLGIRASFAEQLTERMAARRATETEEALKEAKDSRGGHGDPYAMSRYQGGQERLSARADSLRTIQSTNRDAESSADILSKGGNVLTASSSSPSSLLTPSMTAAATLLIGAIDAYVDEVDAAQEEEEDSNDKVKSRATAAKGQSVGKGLTSKQRTVTSTATVPTRLASPPKKPSAPSASASPRLVDYLIDRQIQQTLEDRANKERIAQQREEIKHFKNAIKGISVSKAYTTEAQRAAAFHAAKARLESAMGTANRKHANSHGFPNENEGEEEEEVDYDMINGGGGGAAVAARKVTEAVNALYGGVDGLGRQHRVARASAANVATQAKATTTGSKTVPSSSMRVSAGVNANPQNVRKAAVTTNKTSHATSTAQRCNSSNGVVAGGGAAGVRGGGAFHDPRFPLLSSAHRKEVLLIYDQLHRGKDLLRLASFMIREAFVLGASAAMAHQQQASDARHEARKAAIAARAALSPGGGSSYALFLASAADRGGERSRIRAHRERYTSAQSATASGGMGMGGGTEGPLVAEADDFGVPLALIDALGDLSSRLATRKRERSAFLRNYEKAQELAERTRQQLASSATTHEGRNERGGDLLHFGGRSADGGVANKNQHATNGVPSTLDSYRGDEEDYGADEMLGRRREDDDGNQLTARDQERLAASRYMSPTARRPSSRLDGEGVRDGGNTRQRTTNEEASTSVSPSAIPFSSPFSAASFQQQQLNNLDASSFVQSVVGPGHPSRVPSPQLPHHFAASSANKALDQTTRDKYVRDAINYLRSLDFGKWVNGATSNSTNGTDGGAGETAGGGEGAGAYDVHDFDRFYPHHHTRTHFGKGEKCSSGGYNDDDNDEHREKLRRGLMGIGTGRARIDDGENNKKKSRKKRANSAKRDDIGVHESASQAPSNTSSSSSRRQRQQGGGERDFGSFYSSSSRSSGYASSSEGASAGDGSSQDLGSFVDDHDGSTNEAGGGTNTLHQSKHRRRDSQRGDKNRGGGGSADDGPLSALQQKKNAFELICKSAYVDHPLARDEEMGRREKLRQLFVEEVQHLQAMAVPGRRLAASLPREFVAAGDSSSGPVRALSPVASANPYRFSPPAPQRFVPEYLSGAPTSAKQYKKSNMANIEKDRLNRRKIAATGGAGSGSVVGGGSSVTGASSMSNSSAQQAPPFYYSSSLAGSGPSLKPPKSILSGSSSSLVNAEDTNNGVGLGRSSSLRFAVPEGAKGADGRRGDKSSYGVRFAEDILQRKNATDETDTNTYHNNNPLNLSVGSDNSRQSGSREEGSTGRPRVSSLRSVQNNSISDDDEETRQILANDSGL